MSVKPVRAIEMKKKSATDDAFSDKPVKRAPAVKRVRQKTDCQITPLSAAGESIPKEGELAASEAGMRSIIDTTPDAVLILDTHGTILFANSAAEVLFGQKRKDLIGTDFGYPVVAEETAELEVPARDGSLKTAEMRIVDIAWEAQKALLISFRDITERKRAEAALREKTVIAQTFMDALPAVAMLIRPRTREIVALNKAAGETGARLGSTCFGSWPKSADSCSFCRAPEAWRTGEPQTIEIESLGRFWEAHWVPVSEDLYLHYAFDITARRQAAEALRKTEEGYRLVVDNMADVITVMDLNLRFTYVSPSILRLRGYTAEEVMAQTLEQIMTPESLQVVARVLEEELQLEASGTVDPDRTRILELEEYTKDGSIIWLENHLSALRDKEEKLLGIIALSRDITARKRAEEARRESEERFRKIFEEANLVGIVITSPSFAFEKVNPAFCHMMGYSEDELRSMTFADITHPDHLAQDMDNVMKVGSGEMSFYKTEKRYLDKSGKVLWGSTIVSSIRDGHGALRYYLSTVIDITEQKKGVALLLEANTKYRDLAESISDVFVAMDKHLRYTYWNRASEELTGMPAEKVLGKSLREIFPDNQARKRVEDLYLLTIETKKPQHLTVNYPGDELLVHAISSYPTAEGVSVIVKDVTDHKKAERHLRETLQSLRKAVGTTIQVMVSAVEARDPYTAGHQISSADLARAIATEMGLPQEKIDAVRMAGSIHDIGKMSIPAEILSKPTKLSEIEFSLIKEHARKGYKMLKDVESPWPLAEIVYQHHERMDGSGYPRHLKGDDILIEARILAVADTVEAMASHRPYRPGRGIDAALEEIEKNRGTIYDKAVADACLRLFREKGYRLAET